MRLSLASSRIGYKFQLTIYAFLVGNRRRRSRGCVEVQEYGRPIRGYERSSSGVTFGEECSHEGSIDTQAFSDLLHSILGYIVSDKDIQEDYIDGRLNSSYVQYDQAEAGHRHRPFRPSK